MFFQMSFKNIQSKIFWLKELQINNSELHVTYVENLVKIGSVVTGKSITVVPGQFEIRTSN